MIAQEVKNSLVTWKQDKELHDGAAGFNMSGNKIDQLLQYASKNLSASDFENCYTVDYILDGATLDPMLLYRLAEHPELFGNHINEPTVVIKNIALNNLMVMGANRDSVKISYNGIDYVKFKDIDFIEEINNNKNILLTVYGKINLNNWGGHTSIQIFINDYELQESTSKYDF